MPPNSHQRPTDPAQRGRAARTSFHGCLEPPRRQPEGRPHNVPDVGGQGQGPLRCAVPPPPPRLRQRHRPLPFQTSLTPPKVTLSLLQQGCQRSRPGDARRGTGCWQGTPTSRPGAEPPPYPDGAGTQGDGGPARLAQPDPPPPKPTPDPPSGSPGEPRPPLGPRSRLSLGPRARSLRAGPAGGSSKALPLLNPSIIDIVAEPPGAGGGCVCEGRGGWQRYYLHLSSFPVPPPFSGRLKSREIRRWKSRLRLLGVCRGGGGGGYQADPLPGCGPRPLSLPSPGPWDTRVTRLKRGSPPPPPRG